jgi:hypothetical protein
MKNEYAVLSWTPEDVVDLVNERGGEISTYAAQKFLARHEEALKDLLTQHGWELLEQFMDDDSGHEREKGEDDGREYGHPGDHKRGLE